MKALRILLILIAVISIGVALSYPIRYYIELNEVTEELESLSDMRRRAMERQAEAPSPTEPSSTEAAVDEATAPPTQPPALETEAPSPEPQPTATEAVTAQPEPSPTTVTSPPTEAPTATAEPKPDATESGQEVHTPEPVGTQPPAEATASPTPSPTPTLSVMDFIINDPDMITPTPVPTTTPKPTPSPTPSPTPNRKLRDDADTYRDKQKVELDESMILPELREIYALNHDLVGWLSIEGTNIDYPVVQNPDRLYYLRRDFYGNDNANGQIILDTGCDPYTPSYNLIISGHHMNSGAMFGRLQQYREEAFWRAHKIVEFDTLMARKQYVVFAAFYSADYDEREDGFRYSVNIEYKMDADHWLKEIHENQIYDTGIDAGFGDEFITLTTCDHSRRSDGRFVVVARRIREGEKIV